MLDSARKKKLRSLAHALKPVVIIGQAGLTEPVLAEIEIALDHHELIKVKVRAERDERSLICGQICAATHAELVQTIGQIAVLYRLNLKKKIKKK